MSGPLILALVAVSSAVAYGLGRRRGLGARSLGRACNRLAETLGLGVSIFVANLALGVVFALTMRASGRFVSLYDVADPALLVLSLLEALLWQCWRAEDRSARP